MQSNKKGEQIHGGIRKGDIRRTSNQKTIKKQQGGGRGEEKSDTTMSSERRCSNAAERWGKEDRRDAS